MSIDITNVVRTVPMVISGPQKQKPLREPTGTYSRRPRIAIGTARTKTSFS